MINKNDNNIALVIVIVKRIDWFSQPCIGCIKVLQGSDFKNSSPLALKVNLEHQKGRTREAGWFFQRHQLTVRTCEEPRCCRWDSWEIQGKSRSVRGTIAAKVASSPFSVLFWGHVCQFPATGRPLPAVSCGHLPLPWPLPCGLGLWLPWSSHPGTSLAFQQLLFSYQSLGLLRHKGFKGFYCDCAGHNDIVFQHLLVVYMVYIE